MKPIWLVHAEKDAGTKEKRGGENPRILEYFTHTTYHAKEDEVPWCSAAVCCWLEEVMYPSTKSAAAKSWLDYGVELKEPREGCICVIQQRYTGKDKATGSSSGYHVALWLDQDADHVTLFGGNQSDSVKVSSFNLNSYRVCGYRWPLEGV